MQTILRSLCISSKFEHEVFANYINVPCIYKPKLSTCKVAAGQIEHVAIGPTRKAATNQLLLKLLLCQGLPFTFSQSDHFRDFCSILNPAYAPPCAKTLSTTLLEALVEEIQAAVAKRIASSDVPFLGLTLDGWSRKAAAQHMTAICVGWQGVSIFLDCFGKESTKETAQDMAATLQALLLQHKLLVETTPADRLSDVSPVYHCRVAGLTTDTPHVMQSLRTQLRCVPGCEKVLGNDCAAHVLDLVLESMGKVISTVAVDVKDGQAVSNFFASGANTAALLRMNAATIPGFVECVFFKHGGFSY